MQGEKNGEIGACCGTCKLCSHVCGEGMTWFTLLFVIVSMAALGVLLVMRESLLVLLPEAHFTSHTAFGWAAALGVICVAVAGYGLLALMPFCRFEGLDHRKLFGLVSLVLAVVLLVAASLNVGWALSDGELRAQLEFGWHEAFHGRHAAGAARAAGKRLISEAQRDLGCCGFGAAGRDRSVPPCPNGASGGCEAPLVEELRLALFVLAGLEGGGALLALLAVALVACNAEAEKHGMSRGEAPSGGAMASMATEARRPANPSEVIYPPVMGHFVPGGGPRGFLPNVGVGWDEHALVGGSRGSRSVASRNSSEGAAGAVTHRAAARGGSMI